MKIGGRQLGVKSVLYCKGLSLPLFSGSAALGYFTGEYILTAPWQTRQYAVFLTIQKFFRLRRQLLCYNLGEERYLYT